MEANWIIQIPVKTESPDLGVARRALERHAKAKLDLPQISETHDLFGEVTILPDLAAVEVHLVKGPRKPKAPKATSAPKVYTNLSREERLKKKSNAVAAPVRDACALCHQDIEEGQPTQALVKDDCSYIVHSVCAAAGGA